MEIVTACLVVEQSLRKVSRGALVHLLQHLLPFLYLSFSSTNKNHFYASPPIPPPPHTQTIITASTTLKMPLYDYRIAKTALSEGEKDRILAVYLNTTADAVTCSFPPASPQAVLTHI